jgi:hypothetical protein
MNILLLTLLIFMQSPVSTGIAGIRGRVLSAMGNPAANIRIALSPVGDGGVMIGITQTDSAGRYRIESVPPGRYYIIAGLVDSPTYLPGVPTRNTATAVSLTAESVVDAPDFRIASQSGGLRVKGRVTRDWLASGEAAPPLEVLLTGGPNGRGRIVPGNDMRFSAGAAPDGSFEFPSLPPGRYRVGFIPNVSQTSFPEVVVDRDIDNLQLTIPLSAMRATVQGTLKIDGVAPLFPLPLSLIGKDRSVERWQFVGDTLSIPFVPIGEYSVKLGDLPQGYLVKSITAGSVDLLTQSLKVTPAGPPPILVTLRVASPMPGVRIVGHITNGGQSRLPFEIQISGVTPGLRLMTRIQPDGSFEFPTVPPGTYSVEFLSSPDAVARTITVGKESPTLVEVPLQMPGLRRISVTILRKSSNADPAPLVPALWPILRPVGSPKTPGIRATRTDDGTFEFLNVNPGSYEITLEREGARGANVLTETAVSVVVTDKDLAGVQLIGQ